jgi:DNA primase catalytic subunit
LNDFKNLKPRTFYATINAYKKIESIEDVRNPFNIEFSTPTFDIDNSIEKWEATIAIAESILEFLEKNGVEKSIILKWSGNGMHIHLNPYSISFDLLKKLNSNPIDIAFAIVEYVNAKLNEKLIEIKKKYCCEKLKLENKIDQQRLFTCPLSLHRKLNFVCICIHKDDLKNFDPSWINVKGYRHYKAWDSYELGEADELAEKSYLEVGGYPYQFKASLRKKKKSISEEIIELIQRNEELK